MASGELDSDVRRVHAAQGTPAATVPSESHSSVAVIKGKNEVPGTITFESNTYHGHMTIWRPLPSVLGNALYQEHKADIIVSAAGYAPVVFSYNPSAPPFARQHLKAAGRLSWHSRVPERRHT
jgi:hypothetical protein